MTQSIELFEPVSENLKTALNHIDTITDYHQAILDIAYDNLKQHEDPERPGTYNVSGWRSNRPWSHALLTGFTKDCYGDLAEFAVMIGKYNQQVCNGGHLQYWGNNYASDGDYTENITLHVILEQLFRDFIDDVTSVINLSPEDEQILKDVQNILRSFRDQLELQGKRKPPYLIADEDGNIYDSDYDEDNYEAGQPTDWCREHWNMLDDQYFKINERLMSILEDYFREKIVHS